MAPAGAISCAGKDTSATVGALGASAAASAASAADSAASAASFRRLAPLPLPVVRRSVVAGSPPPYTHTTIINAFDLLLETLSVYVLGLCLQYAVRNVVRKTPPGRRVRSSDVGGWGAFFAFGGPGVRSSVNYHSHKCFGAGEW